MVDPDDPHWRFHRLWAAAEPAVRGFLHGLVGDPAAVDDLVQETALALYEQLDRYDPERPFVALALGVARNKTKNHWRGRARRHEQELADVALDALAAAAQRIDADLDRERRALGECLRAIQGRNREVLERHYHGGEAPADIAASLGLRTDHIHTLLSRIRAALRRCVEQRLQETP
jgi:RNA polymerase sigma-70 factor (ECF subfamily)